MGNKMGRMQDSLANGAEGDDTEQAAEVSAATQAEDEVITQSQEAVEIENLDLVVGQSVTLVECLPTEECVLECREVEAPAAPTLLNDAEPESEAKETPDPVEPEPLLSVSEPSRLESEPEAKETPDPVEPEPLLSVGEPSPNHAAESKPVAEAQLAPDPAPEPVPEPEPTSIPDVELDPEPISESVPAPAEALEQQTDLLTQESFPEPVISSPPLIDLGVLNVTPQPANTPPSPASILAPVNAEEPSDIPVTQECQDSAEVYVISTLEPGRSEETSECLENLEAAGNLEQLVSDVNEESLSGLLKNLELKGNDHVADLIPTDDDIPDDDDDDEIPDDAPIPEMSLSTELM